MIHLDLILAGSKEVMNVYEKYLQEGTELTLSSDLLHILRLESTQLLTQRIVKPNRHQARVVRRSREEPSL